MIQTHYHTVSFQPEANQFVADFVSERIWGKKGTLTQCATMGVTRDGNLVGGVVFHEYRTEVNTMQMSIAGDKCRWLNRTVVNAAMHFSFELTKVGAVWAMVSEKNDAALKMDRIIFPNESYVPHMFGEGVGGYMMTLSANEWKSHRLYRPLPI